MYNPRVDSFYVSWEASWQACRSACLHPKFNLPTDFNTNFLMLVRWIHFLAGITWIGLLYFFNLVNVPLMKELDADH